MSARGDGVTPGSSREQTQPLHKLWERRLELSGKASDQVRTLALAGVAIAWLFSGGSDVDGKEIDRLASAPPLLLLAAALFAASLGADTLHYYLGAAAMRKVARTAEMQGLVSDDPVVVRPWVNCVPNSFYNMKVIALFLGYAILTWQFLSAIF